MDEALTVTPTKDAGRLRGPDGTLLTPPADWAFLPPGDGPLTRRVKEAGPSWTVVEQRGRKKFTRGVWAPASTIETHRRALAETRATPEYTRKRTADVTLRERKHEEYVGTFAEEVRRFLDFAAAYADLAERLTDAVTRHATPVGSGTVARTTRISVDERAEAAVIAWLRHQTTAYDSMKIERVKGKRRQVRQELARISRRLLDTHRGPAAHPVEGCALCRVLNPDATIAG